MLRNAAHLLCLSLCFGLMAGADPIPSRHLQGELHGFLTVHDEGGKLLGYADDLNVRVGNAWRSRLTIRFLDGSLSDETTTFTQGKVLHMLTDHLVQKGPSFPRPTDTTIDTTKNQVTYRDDKDGKNELKIENLDLPADLANGMLPLVMQNLAQGGDEVKVSFLVLAPKPRVVRFAIHPEGKASFKIGTTRSANRYRIHVEIGGIEGVVAPLIGKEPPDMEVWVSAGEAPTMLKLRGFLFEGGPLWTLQLVSPQW